MNNCLSNVFVAISLMALLFGCSDSKKALHVYTWSDYFDPELIQKFEQDNNCKVIIDTFDSNEAMYAKLKAGGTGYDVMTPSTYQVQTLVKEQMLMQLDKSMLTNVIKNFNHRLDNQVLDKDMTWSVPYAVTYGGLMCCSNEVGAVTSWSIIADKRFKGKVSLLDDIRETIGIGLMYNGFSLNSTNENEIMTAAKTMMSWKDNVRKFDAESYKLEVANKSSLIGHGYSSDAYQVMFADGRDDIVFILPDEGFTIAWDEFVVSSTAKQPELAHKFIDFFYDDDNAYQNMQYICTLMPNKNAFDKIEPKYRDAFMPKNIDKGQLLKGFDDPNVLEMYNKAWDMIKSIK